MIMSKGRRRALLGATALVGAAVATELRKPAAERTWQGSVLGLIPYDLRVPTVEKVKNALWNPDGERVLVPHPFGVGWTVNVGRLVRLVLTGIR